MKRPAVFDPWYSSSWLWIWIVTVIVGVTIGYLSK
jgi:hypothetical protein